MSLPDIIFSGIHIKMLPAIRFVSLLFNSTMAKWIRSRTNLGTVNEASADINRNKIESLFDSRSELFIPFASYAYAKSTY